MKSKLLFTLLFVAISYCTFAQNQVVLKGKVLDCQTQEDIIGAYVKFLQKGVQKALATTDFEGNYTIGLPPDVYDIEITYVGLKTILIKNVSVSKGTTLNFEMETNDKPAEWLGCVYKIPIIMKDVSSSGATYTSEQIMHSPR